MHFPFLLCLKRIPPQCPQMPHLRWVQKVPRTANRSSPVKKLMQKAGCYPEGCDRWQGHCAELRWLTQVERDQGAGSRALEIIPGPLHLLTLAIPHPSELCIWRLEIPDTWFDFSEKEQFGVSSRSTVSKGALSPCYKSYAVQFSHLSVTLTFKWSLQSHL